jgi:hypothetical protein
MDSFLRPKEEKLCHVNLIYVLLNFQKIASKKKASLALDTTKKNILEISAGPLFFRTP